MHTSVLQGQKIYGAPQKVSRNTCRQTRACEFHFVFLPIRLPGFLVAFRTKSFFVHHNCLWWVQYPYSILLLKPTLITALKHDGLCKRELCSQSVADIDGKHHYSFVSGRGESGLLFLTYFHVQKDDTPPPLLASLLHPSVGLPS